VKFEGLFEAVTDNFYLKFVGLFEAIIDTFT